MGWAILFFVALFVVVWFWHELTKPDSYVYVYEEAEDHSEELTWRPSEEVRGLMERHGPDIALHAERIEKARENGTSQDHAILNVPKNCTEDALYIAYQAGVYLWNPIRFIRASEDYRKLVSGQYRVLKNAYDAICAERGWDPKPFVS